MRYDIFTDETNSRMGYVDAADAREALAEAIVAWGDELDEITVAADDDEVICSAYRDGDGWERHEYVGTEDTVFTA